MISNEVIKNSVDWKIFKFLLSWAIFGLRLTGLLGTNLVKPEIQVQMAEELHDPAAQLKEDPINAVKNPDTTYLEVAPAAAGGTAEINSEPADRIRQAVLGVPVVGGDPFYLPEGARARLGRGTLRDAVLFENADYLYVAGSIGVFAHRAGISAKSGR